MSEKGKTDFLVLKADFFGLFPEKRPWCGSKIDLKIPGLYLWNQPSSRPFEQDIVNEFFFKPQFHPIMIIKQPIQNAYIFSHAGTPNKIWRNIQWNLISWNFSGFKKNKIKLKNVPCCLSPVIHNLTGCKCLLEIDCSEYPVSMVWEFPERPLCEK